MENPQQLDVRSEAPARRHELIFQTYHALAPGRRSSSFEDRTLPVVSSGTTTLSGTAAIERLGDELLRRRSAPASCA